MRRPSHPAVLPLGARAYLLLMLAVLAGVVAMHGLGSPSVPANPHPRPVSGHVRAAPEAAHAETCCGHSEGSDGSASGESCEHADHGSGGGSGGHVEHADGTCAAGGTSNAPALPALAPVAVVTDDGASVPGMAPAAALGGRAPPSLSELQLLRI
ncbi:DUF6153 family protein [Streptomyces sp. NPDC004647]|uniref:DUF6153 family protein n=1 Tax=Streptomyces sp. NPDC004647 TaxID=3154671 RepID=UPI0033A57203